MNFGLLSPNRLAVFLFSAAITGLFGALSLGLGKDQSWDLLNYHFYNPYSLLYGRLRFDIAPAQLQTFLNPAIDLIPYLLMTHYDARVVSFILGALHGVNFLLVFGITRTLLRRIQVSDSMCWVCCLAAGAFGCYGAGFIQELGGQSHDNTISVFVLGGLWLAIKGVAQAEEGQIGTARSGKWIWSGFLVGLATGLKLTAAPYAIAIAIGIIAAMPNRQTFIYRLPMWGASVACGFLLAAGWWMRILWIRFRNPLFPFCNHIFKSPWWSFENFADMRWHPKNVMDALAYPIRMALNGERTSEVFLRDGRFLILMTVLGAVFMPLAYARCGSFTKQSKTSGLSGRVRVGESELTLLTVFCAATFIVWVVEFGYYRYLISLEILIPAYLIFVSLYWARIRRWLFPIMIVLLSINAAWLRPPSPSRIPWQYSTGKDGLFEHRKQTYLCLTAPPLPAGRNMIVMLGSEPMAYLIPLLPKELRFVRPEGNLYRSERNHSLLLTSIWQGIQEYSGNLFVLIPANENAYRRIPDVFGQDSVWNVGRDAPIVLKPNTGVIYWLVPMKRRE